MAQIIQPREFFLAALAGWINRHQQAAIDFLREENRILLEQLGDRRIRLTDDQRRRLAIAGKAVGRKALLDLAALVTPDTILAWHRKLVAAKWDQHKKRRGPGRPGVMRVHFAGMAPNPDEPWIRQVGRNLTDPIDGFFHEKRFCLMDRDTKFTAAFRALLDDSGTESVRLPARSPNLNAWIERFMRSIKSECLDRMIFFGEASLRRAVREYLAHYHAERNHQGLDNAIIEPEAIGKGTGPIRCRERLGGMLRYYHREAA